MNIEFAKLYHDIPLACCLFDGLQLIAKNKYFEKLPIFGTMQIGDILQNYIQNYNTIKQIINFGKTRFAIPTQNNVFEKYHFTWLSQPYQFAPELFFVAIKNDSAINLFSRELKNSRTIDLQTKLLLPMAFKSQLEQQLTSKKNIFGTLLFVLFKSQNIYLTANKKIEFLTSLCQMLQNEFGIDCLISRLDDLLLAIFIKSLANQPAMETNIKHFINRLNKFIKIKKYPFQFYLGTSNYPLDANNYDDLAKCAQLALRESLQQKIAKTNSYNRFSQNLNIKQQRQQQLAKDLPYALQNGQIVAWFQPIFSSQNKTIVSFEALVRWQHPQFGNIHPNDILRLAQQNNLIDKLTSLMISCAAKQASFWPKQIKFAINVSGQQLTPALVNLIRQQLYIANIAPEHLEIELTENMLIKDFSTCQQTINRLRALGVSIAMDDFGAGYTSFNYLRKLKFDKIKIDKSISASLPKDKYAAAIIVSTIELGKRLNIEIVVEGIERQQQLEFLQKFNCSLQGFVLQKPISPEQLDLLRAKKEFLFPNFL